MDIKKSCFACGINRQDVKQSFASMVGFATVTLRNEIPLTLFQSRWDLGDIKGG
jgi:hypothetical protein